MDRLCTEAKEGACMSSKGSKGVLVTGASGGLGKATSIHLARRGYHVAATSRDLARLDGLMAEARSLSLPVSGYQLDINDPGDVARVVPTILDQVGELDGLVNNAGYGLWGCLEDLAIDEVRAQFETSLYAVLQMSQAVLPHMRARGTGTIINVGSVVGRIVIPRGGAYVASKFALEGLTKAMRMEVAQFGVRVVLVEPGLFRTNFSPNKVFGERSRDPASPYYDYTQRVKSSASGRRQGNDPERFGKTIEKILASKHPKPRYQVGVDARLGNLASKLLPDSIIEYLVKRSVAG